MGAFSRSWELTKVTFGVINKDKELFSYPVLSIIVSVIFLALTVVIALFGGVFSIAAGLSDFSLSALGYLLLFVTYFGLALIGTFFSTAVVYTAGRRFKGEDATFGESISFSFKRIDKIFLWALISATVGLILRILENIAEKMKGVGQIVMAIMNSILGTVWSVLTIFVVQGIVFKNLGPFAAIKDSTLTLKNTWGESLIKYIGFGLAESVFIIPAIVIGIPAIYLSLFVGVWLTLIIIGMIILYIVGVALVFNIADNVFNTALYVYSNTGNVPEGYDSETIKSAFQKKKNEGMQIPE